jgi:hypothetical protein
MLRRRLELTSMFSLRQTAYLLVPVAIALLVLLASAARDASGSIVWRGNFETGDFSQWVWGVQQKTSGRASIVSSPVREGRYGARCEVRPGDNNVAGSGNGERCEWLLNQATTDGYEGREQWWAWSTYFDPTFSPSSSGWNSFIQFHHLGPTGQANIWFSSVLNTIQFRVANGDMSSPTTKWWVLDPNRKNSTWYDFVFHVKWSSDPNVGFVEVWINGQKVLPLVKIATLYPGVGVYLKQGYYRAAQTTTAIIYHDGMRRGSSYDDVVAGFPAGSWAGTSIVLPKPVIGGSPVVGKTLTASVNTSGLAVSSLAYQWLRCDSGGGGCQAISGATSSSYLVAKADATSTLRVRASAQTASGTVTATSDPTVPVTVDALPPPEITGVPVVGNVLKASVDPTGLPGDVLSIAYQWQKCGDTAQTSCVNITGATAGSYSIPLADLGARLQVRATAKTTTSVFSSLSAQTSPVGAGATPPPPSPSLTVSSSIANGATLTGKVSWSASPSTTVSKIEFSIDGALRWTDSTTPYVFDGDGNTLDTATLGNGNHTFSVKAYASDGATAVSSATATVANTALALSPLPVSISVSSSITDGEVLTGSVSWTASVGGAAASRVDFYVDGALAWTERLAPYVFNGDGNTLETSNYRPGKHRLEVTAYSAEGATATVSATVQLKKK